MNKSERIRHQLEIAYRGPAWHGPSLLENLDGVSASTAAAYPIATAHSIWETVNHIAAWIKAANRMIERNQYISLQGEEDWPPVDDTSETAWNRTIADLDRAHQDLSTVIEKLPENQLGKMIPGRDYTFYVVLHGLVQHNVYHTGQIGLLRKSAR